MIIICITIVIVVMLICITYYFVNRDNVMYFTNAADYQALKDINIIAMNEFSRNQDIINDYDDDDNQLKIAAENLLNALDTINTMTRDIREN